jgi:hypothetical protein
MILINSNISMTRMKSQIYRIRRKEINLLWWLFPWSQKYIILKIFEVNNQGRQKCRLNKAEKFKNLKNYNRRKFNLGY